MTEPTLELTLELAGGEHTAFVNITADENHDYEIQALYAEDDNGDEVNLWGLLLVEEINSAVDDDIRNQLKAMEVNNA